MIINLKRVEKLIKKEYAHLEIEAEYEVKSRRDGRIKLSASIVSPENFDDSVLVNFYIYTDGFITLRFVFDRLEHNLENHLLVNNFNVNTPFKGSIEQISDELYFVIEYATVVYSSHEAVNVIINRFNRLLSDDVLKYLQPIAAITN